MSRPKRTIHFLLLLRKTDRDQTRGRSYCTMWLILLVRNRDRNENETIAHLLEGVSRLRPEGGLVWGEGEDASEDPEAEVGGLEEVGLEDAGLEEAADEEEEDEKGVEEDERSTESVPV